MDSNTKNVGDIWQERYEKNVASSFTTEVPWQELSRVADAKPWNHAVEWKYHVSYNNMKVFDKVKVCPPQKYQFGPL